MDDLQDSIACCSLAQLIEDEKLARIAWFNELLQINQTLAAVKGLLEGSTTTISSRFASNTYRESDTRMPSNQKMAHGVAKDLANAIEFIQTMMGEHDYRMRIVRSRVEYLMAAGAGHAVVHASSGMKGCSTVDGEGVKGSSQ